MARAKLTDPEKQEILRLFKESGITATKLAEDFSVSISTISRLLKTELSEVEYATLSASRRKSGTALATTNEFSEAGTLDLFDNAAVEQAAEAVTVQSKTQIPKVPVRVQEILPVFSEEMAETSPVALPITSESSVIPEELTVEAIPQVSQENPGMKTAEVVILEPLEIPIPRRRRRSAAVPETPLMIEEAVVETAAVVETPTIVEAPVVVAPLEEAISEVDVEPMLTVVEEVPTPEQPVRSRILKKSERVASAPPPESSERLAAPLAELEAEFAASPGQFAAEDFDDDEDFEDVEEDDGSGLEPELAMVASALPVEVLPFSSAEFPRTCWVMVDRASELLTRPLGDFSNIGAIPDTEREAVTLPIFENHRLARRYSSNYHRPLRLPVHLLSSTRPYLLRKGITRLLVGTQVYALDLAEDGIEEEEIVESSHE
jgi:transcriptional regulator with XRE-family HTH domain